MKLPPEVQDAISSIAIADAIQETGKDYGLRVDQLGVLAEQTTLVLLGIVHPKSFTTRLREALPQSISDIQIQSLAEDINTLVFEPIHDSIIGMHQKTQNTAGTSPQPAPHPIVQPSVQPAPQQPHTTPTPPSGPSASITHTLPKDSAQTKLEQSFRIPASATTIKESSSAPVAPKAIDPYREATD